MNRPLEALRARQASSARSDPEAGFLLIGAVVAIALVLIVLAIAAPRVAADLRRDREVEAVHRGNMYVRAIQLYYRQFHHYPGSIEQLEKTNNIRFLRQRYTDPITGKDDFRTIPVGQNQTTVKTFFGEPITGLPGTGAGAIAGASAPGAGAFGSTPAGAAGAAPGSAAVPATGTAAGAPGTGTTAAAPGSSVSAGGANLGGAGASSPSSDTLGSPAIGGGAPFMGVGLGTTGDSILEPNEQTSYDTWEFLYDPRLDQLKAKAAALNGGPGSVPGSSLGQGNGVPAATTPPGTSSPPTGTDPGPGRSGTGSPPGSQP